MTRTVAQARMSGEGGRPRSFPKLPPLNHHPTFTLAPLFEAYSQLDDGASDRKVFFRDALRTIGRHENDASKRSERITAEV